MRWGSGATRRPGWLRTVVAQWRTSRAPLDAHAVARILVDVANGTLRDVVTGDLSRSTASTDHDLWADIARRVPTEHATIPLILAGLTAWLQAHGALAWMAYEQAHDHAPAEVDAFALASVLRDLITHGVSPHKWDDFAATLRDDDPATTHTAQSPEPAGCYRA